MKNFCLWYSEKFGRSYDAFWGFFYFWDPENKKNVLCIVDVVRGVAGINENETNDTKKILQAVRVFLPVSIIRRSSSCLNGVITDAPLGVFSGRRPNLETC